MPAGKLYINDYDAFTRWGVSLSAGSLAQLLTPAPLKEHVKNSNRLQHGSRVTTSAQIARTDERELALEMHLVAADDADFLAKYSAFCTAVLYAGKFTLKTAFSGDVYRLVYLSCSQLSYIGGLAKFSLKVVEPDVTNRGVTDETESGAADMIGDESVEIEAPTEETEA